MFELTRTTALRARSVAGITLHNLALQDAVALTFHAFILLRILAAPDSHDATLARRGALALFTITACTMVLTRGELLQRGRLRALVYRLGVFVPMLLSYFELRRLLPALQAELFDLRLLAIDHWVLGTTPAVWFNQFNVTPVVEWVSFFYYSYFYVMVAMIITPLFFDNGKRVIEILGGSLLIAAVGHSLYTLVPGAGPYATLVFDEPLRGGFWWRQVEVTVATAGAQLDIFPSLHTAYPVFFALHGYAHRHTKAFRFTWPLLAFIAANIMVATMFLRWHWAVDVFVGLLLALAARGFARFVSDREGQRGTRADDRQMVWEPLFR